MVNCGLGYTFSVFGVVPLKVMRQTHGIESAE
jgi:hypothetical protein